MHGSTAELKKGTAKLANVSDCLDIMANAHYQEADSVILHSHDLPEDFFDLKTKVAGEILQKFSNYRMSLAIIGDWSDIKSNSLSAFIKECNRGGHIYFADSREDAIAKLATA